jgi:hypothetical protein
MQKIHICQPNYPSDIPQLTILTIRLDSAEGPVIGTVKIQPTRSLDNYRSFTAKVKNAYGVHDLYLCFDQCTKEVHLDWWSFK